MELLYSGQLHSYFANINEQAKVRFDFLVEQMAENEGVIEKLKAENKLEWVGRMNNIRDRAEGLVMNDLIYA